MTHDGENTSKAQFSFSVSGRDDTLLKILAHKMNFKLKYVDVTSLAGLKNYENVSEVGLVGLEMLKQKVKLKSHELSFSLIH